MTTVLVVENLPLPLDRHVWQQALALRDAGWRVFAICPRGHSGDPMVETLDEIHIYRHFLFEARRGLGYLFEYSLAILSEMMLLAWIFVRHGFAVIHACNPPDLILPLCLPFRLFGVRLIFDHHDLTPELMEVRFRRGLLHRLSIAAERASFRAADVVLSSNATFRNVAIQRGGIGSDRVHIVHTVPELAHLQRVTPDKAARGGRGLVLGYLGIIGVQDGLDQLLKAARALINEHALADFRVVIVGDGPALPKIRALAHRLGLEDHVHFTGYLSGQALWAQLSDFDIGVIPDPINPFNNSITMNKVFEYSALGIPTIAYPLTETVRMLQDAGTFAEHAAPEALADALCVLMKDKALRRRKAKACKTLADTSFSWETEKASLLRAYAQLVALRGKSGNVGGLAELTPQP